MKIENMIKVTYPHGKIKYINLIVLMKCPDLFNVECINNIVT